MEKTYFLVNLFPFFTKERDHEDTLFISLKESMSFLSPKSQGRIILEKGLIRRLKESINKVNIF